MFVIYLYLYYMWIEKKYVHLEFVLLLYFDIYLHKNTFTFYFK